MSPGERRSEAIACARCPNCGASDADRPNFTWWGGMLGPKLLSHAVCRRCRTGFNAKTGTSNTAAIAIYSVAGLVLALVIFAVVRN